MLSRRTLAIAVTLVVTSLGASQIIGRWKFERTVEQFHAEEVAWRAQDFSRPSPHGEAEEGNAMPLIASALELARAAGKGAPGSSIDAFERRLLDDPDLDPTAEDARWSQALDALHRAARKSEARPLFSFEDGLRAQPPSLLHVRRLTNVALRHAQQLARAGDDTAAAATLLDVFSFGRDLAHGEATLISEAIGCMVLGFGFDALTREEQPIELGPEGWRTLASGLARIDAGFRVASPGWTTRRLLLGREFERMVGEGQFPSDFLGPLCTLAEIRRGFSSRWFFADVLADFQARERSTRELEETPWPEFLEGLEREQEAWDDSGPSAKFWGPAPSIFTTRRCSIAELRLLRLLAASKAGLSPPDCRDPFGDRFRRRSVEGGLLVWSVGSDGMDAGANTEAEDAPVVFLPAS